MHTIRQFEESARRLEPDSVTRNELLKQVAEYAGGFLEGLADAPAYSAPDKTGDAAWASSIGEQGAGIAETLALLRTQVDSAGVNLASGRYLGYIPGGGLFHAALGDFLAAVANRYAGLFFISPGAVRIENALLRWMAGIVGYPESSAGNLTSGGSSANLSAVIAARDAFGIGQATADRAVVYTTGHVHHSITKALHIAGLDACIRRTVPAGGGYRMDAAALSRAVVADQREGLMPWLVVASAGTTNTGSVDPLEEIAAVAAAHRLWYHVDGAYGALFALCPEGKAVLAGLEKSDSMVLDPHKTLFLPYGTGAVLVRERQKLYAAFNADADYIQNIQNGSGELSPADLSPELTKHFRGLRLWLSLKLLGVAAFRAALSEKILLARHFYARLGEIDGFELGPPPDLSIVTYRYLPRRGDPDEFNDRLRQAIQQQGRIFISSTRVDGRLVLRAAVLSFRTHLDEIDEAIRIISQTAKQLEQECS